MKKIYIILGLSTFLVVMLAFRYVYFKYQPRIEISTEIYTEGALSYEGFVIMMEDDIVESIQTKVDKISLNSRQVNEDLKHKYYELGYKKIEVGLKIYEKGDKTILEYKGDMIDADNKSIKYNKKYEYDFSLGSIEIKDNYE